MMMDEAHGILLYVAFSSITYIEILKLYLLYWLKEELQQPGTYLPITPINSDYNVLL